MLTVIRHSTHRFRTWLIAIAAILVIASVLEAGHAHGVFTPDDDHCTLCQHSFALDKTLLSSASFIVLLLLAVVTFRDNRSFIPTISHRFALIRAPPQLLQHR